MSETIRTMIQNHEAFLEAIQKHSKVCVRFYSHSDGGVLDRVCAPVDYGPDIHSADGLNRYWVWDYQAEGDARLMGLVPAQIVDVRILGQTFDPGDVVHAQRTAVTDTANTGAWSPSIGPQDQLVRCAPCETPDEGSRHALVDRS
jgi:hypothetical protein